MDNVIESKIKETAKSRILCIKMIKILDLYTKIENNKENWWVSTAMKLLRNISAVKQDVD